MLLQGLKMIVYKVDRLFSECLKNEQDTRKLMTDLRLFLNIENSVFIPTKTIDSDRMSVYLPHENKDFIQHECRLLLHMQ